jgi:glutathione S-transferase
MKLYDCQMAPNPRRARIFLAEKGLDIEKEEIGIFEGDNLKPAYLDKSPLGLVPSLELDDGTILTEVPAICRYLESQHPEPNLMGKNPLETARVEAWERFAEMNGMQAVGEYFRNATPGFDDRGLPGMTGIPRLPALVERGEKRIAAFYEQLEKRLSESEYLASDRFTLADITAMCVVDFATFTEHGIPEGNANTKRWHTACAGRPSAAA